MSTAAAGVRQQSTETRRPRRRHGGIHGGAVARRRPAGQALEEYVLILGFVVLPLLVALPSAVAVIQAWVGRLLGWWEMPVP